MNNDKILAVKKYLERKFRYQMAIGEYRRAMFTEKMLDDVKAGKNLDQFDELTDNLNPEQE